MSQLNPYENFLDGRAPEEILAATPNAVAQYLKKLGPGAEKQPAPGKWSAAEIVSHLADCDLVFGFRLRQTMAEDGPTIQPFDQDRWAVQYAGIPGSEALAAFTALRKWNLRLIQSVLPTAAHRTMTHPERGTMTFKTVVETMAGHDLNHLAQLRRLAETLA